MLVVRAPEFGTHQTWGELPLSIALVWSQRELWSVVILLNKPDSTEDASLPD